jgi:hypothetical protein
LEKKKVEETRIEHVIIIIMVQIIIKTFQRNPRAAEQLEAILGQPCPTTLNSSN